MVRSTVLDCVTWEEVPYSAALIADGKLPVEVTDQEEFHEGCYNGYSGAFQVVSRYWRSQGDQQRQEEIKESVVICRDNLVAGLNRGLFLGELAADVGYLLGWLSALLNYGVVGENFVWVTLARVRAVLADRLVALV